LKRSILAAATVAALTAGTIGIAAPAALADPPAGTHGPSTHPHGPGTHGSHQLTNAQRKVQREVTRKDAQLAKVSTFHSFGALSTDDAAAVTANITADQAALAALGDQAAAATTVDEVRTVAAQVHAVRPQVYLLAVSKVRQADRFEAKLLAAQTTLTDLLAQATALGLDVTAVQTALDDAVATTTAAGDLVLALTATSSHEDVQAALAAVADAAQAWSTVAEQVETVLDAIGTSTDPTDPTDPTTPPTP
jgi:hypothetical protein